VAIGYAVGPRDTVVLKDLLPIPAFGFFSPVDLDDALRTLAPRLIAYGVARTGSLASAEDVAQEVLLALIRRWRRLGPPASPAAFVFAIARRRIGRVLARRALMAPIEALRGSAAHGPTIEDAYITRSELRSALADLRTLPSRDREALLLRAIGELTYEEIASVCGSSVAAIKMRVSRARRRLTEFQQEATHGRRRQPV
jgi:RNA polymerase sigma-70 factor (ECF subfamily)